MRRVLFLVIFAACANGAGPQGTEDAPGAPPDGGPPPDATIDAATPLVRLVTRAQMKVDPEARSSMWQDLDRGRPTEVEYLNGEIVRIAERVGRAAPLNRRMVELVHDAERDGPGSPNLDAVTLWSRLVR